MNHPAQHPHAPRGHAPGCRRRGRAARLPLLLLAGLVLAAGGCARQWDGSERSLTGQAGQRYADIAPEALYAAGMQELRARRFRQAVEIFEAIEREHPYSTWATNAKLMSAYAEYMQNRYTEAIGALDRFIQLHPAHRDIAYAYYLSALCQYEQINDAQRDQRQTEVAMAALQEVVNRFPDTAYARDARLKMDLARDHLAGHEMHVGRFYQRQGLYAAAIGRFRKVVDDYQTTNHVPEALHRLTEIYLTLGLVDEARRTAAVLGHNYPGSPWYQDSYALLVAGAPRSEDEQPGLLGRVWDNTLGRLL
ncbi:outer membrane protein assembly factor BamD [Caldovatus aquaticus]|uniref:Outer membrane protein assembly factor BamD n=1 Tax=Caldovatus aquaticus TaxID=2865671 RepID=A0ABS7EWY0_9PROT|nr:outer membrane protein assembly factor BamD [Caldovatus aquaticus]MBW8267879.1 outer membrane protein assembly factor BamD [Caldovatus aquaticus]